MRERVWSKGLPRRRTFRGIRLRWLAVLIILIATQAVFLYFHVHDAILVISLHLNIKLDWIRDLQTNCSLENKLAAGTIHETRPTKDQLLPDCLASDSLLGKLNLGNENEDVKMGDIERQNSEVQIGGKYKPPDCVPTSKVAIIVPHRDREPHLRQFLKNIHPVLQRQRRQYGVYVIHQSGSETFNKAKLLNIGFREASQDDDYDCFVFHDVDLIPEDDRNLYTCSDSPRHLSAGIDKWGYQLPYNALFGGVISIKKTAFEQVNGYSNEYWGWGAEDDDMYVRIMHSCLTIERPPYEYAKYRMVYHPADQRNSVNPYRYTLLVGAAGRQKIDGLSSLRYKVLNKKRMPLYTNVTADVGKPPFTSLMGTGISIAISISIYFLMFIVTVSTCLKSRVIHVLLGKN